MKTAFYRLFTGISLVCTLAWAQTAEEELREIVSGLDAPGFSDRELASDRLAEMGRDALPLAIELLETPRGADARLLHAPLKREQRSRLESFVFNDFPSFSLTLVDIQDAPLLAIRNSPRARELCSLLASVVARPGFKPSAAEEITLPGSDEKFLLAPSTYGQIALRPSADQEAELDVWTQLKSPDAAVVGYRLPDGSKEFDETRLRRRFGPIRGRLEVEAWQQPEYSHCTILFKKGNGAAQSDWTLGLEYVKGIFPELAELSYIPRETQIPGLTVPFDRTASGTNQTLKQP